LPSRSPGGSKLSRRAPRAAVVRDRPGSAFAERAGASERSSADALPAGVAPTLTATADRDHYLSERSPEHEADERRAQLQEARSHGGLAMWTWDLDTDRIECSDELHRICGVEIGTLTTLEDINSVAHPEDRAAVAANHERARVTRERLAYTFRVTRPDGTVRTIEARFETLAGAATRRAIGVWNDAIDGDRLEAQRHYLATLVDASDDAMVAYSLDKVLVAWNRGAERLYGYTAEEAIGQTRSLIVPPDQIEASDAVWERAVNGESSKTVETVRRTKDGRRLTLSSAASPITDGSGAVIGLAAISRDITELKQAEARLAEAHSNLLEVSRLKAEFIANMTHELRTPLNGIIGGACLLADTAVDDEQRELVAMIQVSGDKLMSVVDSVLDFSKIEAGKVSIDHSAFDIRALVEEIRLTVSCDSQQRAIPLTMSIDAAVPKRLLGDHKRVRQVTLNLVRNAIEFTESGEVAMRVSWTQTESHRGRLDVEVSDTGIGIAEVAKELIFKPFVQADGSMSRSHGGIGLGLTLAKELVEAMGGDIGVRSTVGTGSTFWFALPMTPAAAEPLEPKLPSFAGARMLVAVADGADRETLTHQLEGWDVAVATASDVESTVDALRAGARSGRPYDVALLDHALPGVANGELVGAIESDASLGAVRVIVAAPDNVAADRAQRGADHWLVSKPLDPHALYGEIARAFDADDRRGARNTDAEHGGDKKRTLARRDPPRIQPATRPMP
jgi:two-component system, sensor histidine kinase and response regulator